MDIMSFFFSVLSFLQIERERVVYKIWVWRSNSPKVTYLIFRRGFTGESFFFHGLIDFMLFLILAWRTRVPRVSDILLSSTRNTSFGSSARYEPCQTIDFFSFFFRRRGEGCHFRFRAPANHLASLSFSLPVSGDLRLLSTNICWYPLCDLHSFLMVFLTVCHCSFRQEDSINLISIVSVGYHMTEASEINEWRYATNE